MAATRAWEQRNAELEAMVADLCASMKQMNQTHGSDHFSRSGEYRRFGEDEEEDPLAELKKLKETDGIRQYHQKFENIRTRLKLPEDYLMSVYLAGLRLETRRHIKMFQPQTVRDCFFLGKAYEKVHPKPPMTANWNPKSVNSMDYSRDRSALDRNTSPSMEAWRSGSSHSERSGDDRWFSEEDRKFREYLMLRNNDDDETWTETDWWYRSEKENPEDQVLNCEELVESEVATDPIETEHELVSQVVDSVSEVLLVHKMDSYVMEVEDEIEPVTDKERLVMPQIAINENLGFSEYNIKDESTEVMIPGNHMRMLRQLHKSRVQCKMKVQKMDLFSFGTHTEMEGNVELKQLLAAMERFSQEVIEQNIEGGLSCGDVKFHLKHKWRFRLLELFSRLELLDLINLWLSKAYAFSGQLQEVRKGEAESFPFLNFAAKQPLLWMQNTCEPILIVSEFERTKKKLCYKTWMFKYKGVKESIQRLQILLRYKNMSELKGSVSAERESESNQPTLRFSTWDIEILLNHYMVLLLTLVAYAIQFLGGVGMDKKQSPLSHWINRVWDPGRSLVKDASYSTRVFSSLPATVPVSLLCQEAFAYQITFFSTNLEVKVSLKGEDLLQVIWVMGHIGLTVWD